MRRASHCLSALGSSSCHSLSPTSQPRQDGNGGAYLINSAATTLSIILLSSLHINMQRKCAIGSLEWEGSSKGLTSEDGSLTWEVCALQWHITCLPKGVS